MPARAALPAVLALAAAVAGCVAAPAARGDGVAIRVENDTTVPVGLYVDGSWVGTYPAGAARDVVIGQPPNPPFEVELRSPSDAVLVELGVNAGQLDQARAGTYGAGESVGLPCGVLTVVVGSLQEDEALAPAASVPPGPCP